MIYLKDYTGVPTGTTLDVFRVSWVRENEDWRISKGRIDVTEESIILYLGGRVNNTLSKTEDWCMALYKSEEEAVMEVNKSREEFSQLKKVFESNPYEFISKCLCGLTNEYRYKYTTAHHYSKIEGLNYLTELLVFRFLTEKEKEFPNKFDYTLDRYGAIFKCLEREHN